LTYRIPDGEIKDSFLNMMEAALQQELSSRSNVINLTNTYVFKEKYY